MRTRLCDLLDISVPIIGAPFGPWNSVRLAAAICQAGGLGSLGTAVRPVEQLKEQWAQLRELTDRPFAINHQPRPFSPEAFEATLEARPAVISYHMGDPGGLVDRAHLAGSLWMQQVMDLDQACRAVIRGADIIIAQGSEAGGHSGFVSTLALVPQVVEVAGDRPVVAAGGIADGRGLAAALCLGASGVVMGSRFLASTEMAVRPEWKEMILRADSRDARHSALTDPTLPPYNRPHDPAMARVLPTAFAEQWSERPNGLARTRGCAGAGNPQRHPVRRWPRLRTVRWTERRTYPRHPTCRRHRHDHRRGSGADPHQPAARISRADLTRARPARTFTGICGRLLPVGARPRRLRTMAAFAAVAAVLSACSGDPGGTGDSGAASESAASAAPAGPPPEAVTLAQMDASKIPVSGAPDWMADDGTELVREDR